MLNQIKTPSDREAINQQLEKQREDMRKELNKGIDHIDEGGSMSFDHLSKSQHKGGCCLACGKGLKQAWARWGPLSSKLTHIQRRFDRSIASYFIFFRFVFLLSLLQSAIFGYLLINHFIQATDYDSLCLFDVVPCVILYNSFTKDEALGYSFTLLFFLAVGVVVCLYKLVS